FRVMSKISMRIRIRFVDVFEIGVGGDNTRRACEDQSADVIFVASFNDMRCAADIRLVIISVTSPVPGFGADMENDVASLCSAPNRIRVGEIALRLISAPLLKMRIAVPRKAANRLAAVEQSTNDRGAEESAAARDEGFHRSRLAAQTASF